MTCWYVLNGRWMEMPKFSQLDKESRALEGRATRHKPISKAKCGPPSARHSSSCCARGSRLWRRAAVGSACDAGDDHRGDDDRGDDNRAGSRAPERRREGLAEEGQED